MSNWLSFKITLQTMKDNWKLLFILTVLFMGMASMYAGMYPAFKDTLADMVGGFEESMAFIVGIDDMASYVGFVNAELYQIFWMLILAILLGLVSASTISKEIEAKTIDLLLCNPISRRQIVFEKFIAMIPFVLIINFATLLAVYGTTIAINEELNMSYLVLVHLVSIPYLLAVVGIGFTVSVIIDEKMKASIITMAIIVGMYIFQSISLMIPDYKNLGYLSITHYFNTYDILKFGRVDGVGVIVLCAVALECLLFSMYYFGRRDINVS